MRLDITKSSLCLRSCTYLRITFFSTFLYLLSPCPTSAIDLDNYNLKLTVNNGLPSNTVYCSLIDKTGKLWVATDNGVVTFDGGNYKTITKKDGLSSDEVFKLYCDSKNRIWFSSMTSELSFSYNGTIYNKSNCSFLSQIRSSSSLPTLVEDNKKRIWIIYKPFEVYILNSQNKIQKIHIPGLKNKNCIPFELNSTHLYLLSSEHTVKLNLLDLSFKLINNHGRWVNGITRWGNRIKAITPNDSIITISESDLDKGNIRYYSAENNLLLLNNILFSFNINGFKKYENTNDNIGQHKLKDYSISNIFSTDQDDLLISTKGSGLLYFINGVCKNYPISEYSKIQESVTTVLPRNNHLFIGTSRGKVYKINKLSKQLIDSVQIEFSNALNPFSIIKLIDVGHELLILTDVRVCLYNYKSKLIRDIPLFKNRGMSYKNIYKEQQNYILLTGGTIYKINRLLNKVIDSVKINKRIYCYLPINADTLYGTQDSLLSCNQGFRSYINDITFTNRILDIKSCGGKIFVATKDNGLYEIESQVVKRHWDVNNGLSSNNCAKILIHDNLLIISSKNGLNVLNRITNQINYINYSDGLISKTINDLLLFNDTIYASCEDGVSIIPINKITNKTIFNLSIDDITVNGNKINFKEQLKVHTNDKIRIHLITPNNLDFGRLSYLYLCKRTDSVFSLTSDNIINLTFQEIGKHEIIIKARNSEGKYSRTLSLIIIVSPQYYQTAWFKIIVITIVISTSLSLYVIIYRFFNRRKEELRKTKEKLTSLELSAWKATINPHFLFNSINTLGAFHANNDKDRVQEYLRNFSALLRKTIDYSTLLLIDLKSEVEYLKNYLDLEIEKNQGLRKYQINISHPELENEYIPSLLLQPICENAIKHGLKTVPFGQLIVSFTKDMDKIICVIEDNGIGIGNFSNQSKKKGVGLLLIQSKIRITEKLLGNYIGYKFINKIPPHTNGTITTLTFTKYSPVEKSFS
jgi:ligand-binding sensor domain-containing protein